MMGSNPAVMSQSMLAGLIGRSLPSDGATQDTLFSIKRTFLMIDWVFLFRREELKMIIGLMQRLFVDT